jgi:hypothetical protein
MATKTFKIGLSTTDKQNMAQDVYERLIAMCFDEYDSTKTYNKGDFVVYENPTDTYKLYKCNSDNVTGAWDSTKWDLATFQDLVDDIEDAVAFVNSKANVDGNYPTMTVGAADNLTPYSEDSGDDQDVPFLFQGTGCGNGETQVDTGALALLKEKQGHSVVVNQQLSSPTFSAETEHSISISGSNGLIYANGTSDYNDTDYKNIQGSAPFTFVVGHKYLLFIESNQDFSGKTQFQRPFFTVSAPYGDFYEPTIWTCTENNYLYQRLGIGQGAVYSNATIKYNVIDLTQWFGTNDAIPSHLLSHPEDFFRYYQGSLAYNEGTLVNADGRYLKAIGRNQWDEVASEGCVILNDGSVSGSGYGCIASTNHIKVIPNTDYYFYTGYSVSNYGVRIAWYDKDKNLISVGDYYNAIQTSPSNACYMRFSTNNIYGTTYNHDITISLYYDGESGYDQYYPYEELSNIDTGTETLRSAGSVKDTKTPDGTITRKVGVNNQLNELSFTYDSNNKQFYSDVLSGFADGQVLMSCYSYYPLGYSEYNPPHTRGIIGGRLYIVDETLNGDASALTTKMTGQTLHYALATPTTEQGTTFAENVAINDFGSMDFAGANGVPQGNLIFYPVDYKAFLDSLFNELDGSANKVLSTETSQSDLDTYLNGKGYYKQEDLSSEVTILQSLTKTYCKLVKIGSQVILSLKLENSTGSDIPSNTQIAILPSGTILSAAFLVKAIILSSGTDDGIIEFGTSGSMISYSTIPNNAVLYLLVSYNV